MPDYLRVNVEGRFTDAPADDLSVGSFDLCFYPHEEAGVILRRLVAACNTYNIDANSIKITG